MFFSFTLYQIFENFVETCLHDGEQSKDEGGFKEIEGSGDGNLADFKNLLADDFTVCFADRYKSKHISKTKSPIERLKAFFSLVADEYKGAQVLFGGVGLLEP